MANLSPLRHPDHLLALLVRGLRNGRTHPFRYPAGRAASTPSQGGPFSACRGVRFQSAVNNSPQVMSLLPRTPTSGGSAPGTPRCASASSRAGFARLPCWGRVIPSPDPIPLTPSDLSPSTSLCYLTPCPPNRGKVTAAHGVLGMSMVVAMWAGGLWLEFGGAYHAFTKHGNGAGLIALIVPPIAWYRAVEFFFHNESPRASLPAGLAHVEGRAGLEAIDPVVLGSCVEALQLAMQDSAQPIPGNEELIRQKLHGYPDIARKCIQGLLARYLDWSLSLYSDSASALLDNTFKLHISAASKGFEASFLQSLDSLPFEVPKDFTLAIEAAQEQLDECAQVIDRGSGDDETVSSALREFEGSCVERVSAAYERLFGVVYVRAHNPRSNLAAEIGR